MGSPVFTLGKRSKKSLSTVDSRLRSVIEEASKSFNLTALVGHRGKAEQMDAFRGGTGLEWPRSRHNAPTSTAVDIVPYPIDWDDTRRFRQLNVVIQEIAKKQGVDVEWGGNWKEVDMPHYQIRNP